MLLNVHSYYSLRYGTLSPDDLIKALSLHGYDTAVLTDINNSSGFFELLEKGKAANIQIKAGLEFRNGDQLLYIGIAKNEQGFRVLNELLSNHNKQKIPLPFPAPELENVFIVYPFQSRSAKDLKSYEYIGIRQEDRSKISFSSASIQNHYVILQTISFRSREYSLHCQLRAIDHNILFSQLSSEMVGAPTETFIPKAALLQTFQDFPILIANTEKLLAQCNFNFNFKETRNKKSFTGTTYDDKLLLHRFAMEGLERRYGLHHKAAHERLLKELQIIDQLQFSAYFLITDDICRYARSRQFQYVGRGSGANSIVAYCLGITDVCPIELDLYFERFLNPKRQSPPDFDIDFSWQNRDDIYQYIFHRYQHKNTALMGAMSTFRSRSILRELGKIYGLPKGDIDRLVHEPQNILNKNKITKTIYDLYNQLEDFPNQRTIHASGVLISEQAMTYYTALDYPPKGLPTVQFDMYTAEAIGFEKFDILSQRGIGHIHDCAKIIHQNTGARVELPPPSTLFKDPRIAAQLKSAETIGCFYIESPAMRQLMQKLHCDNYLTLVAASSIIRPGVASSGMMQAYIERHHQPENIAYLHPILKEQLAETYGIMVYQEDVMKIGHFYGGLDLADADVLRRMMSGKYRSKNHLATIEEKFFNHCREQAYPENISKEIWRQIESFAGYSFSKAHSASFAVESYQSLFYKTYYPLEFMVAVLNNYGGYYQRKVYVHEAKKWGAVIHLPCVNQSHYQSSIQGKNLYLGFDILLNLNTDLAIKISKERCANGLYKSLEDFLRRTSASLDQILILIRVGAFRFFNANKKELLWESHFLLSQSKTIVPTPLFFENTFTTTPQLPLLENHPIEDLYDEIELLGFPVSGSLFELAKSDYKGNVLANQLLQHSGQVIRIVGELVTVKTTNTKTGQRMQFGTFWDAEGSLFETIHFPPILKKYPLSGEGLYLLEGRVEVSFGFPSLEVYKCGRMPMKGDPRGV